MFRCDNHNQGAYCVSLLELQCYNSWLKYIYMYTSITYLLHGAESFLRS